MEDFVSHQTKNIHVITKLSPNKPLIVMIPGMFGIAEHYSDEFENLTNYSLVALSLRGRGKSSFYFDDYSLAAHATDVVAVLNAYPAEAIFLMGHSFGCLVAVAAAAAQPKNIKGMILIDKGLTMTKLTEKWMDHVIKNPPPHSSVEIARKVYDASTDIDLTSTINNLKIPTLLFRGLAKGHAISEEEAESLAKLNHIKLVELKHSGHSPAPNDYKFFINEIKKFIEDKK